MSDKILVVDDEQEITDLVELYLQNENYEVFKFYSAKDALACIESTELDLAILDIMLPEVNGFALCQKIRERHTYPIIMLTAKDAETDKITGLTLGADDYVTKPFRPLELVARVKAQLRRYKRYNPAQASSQEQASDLLLHSGLEMNTGTHACFLNEKPLPLTPTEFLFYAFCWNERERLSAPRNCFTKFGRTSITAKATIRSPSTFGICVRSWATP